MAKKKSGRTRAPKRVSAWNSPGSPYFRSLPVTYTLADVGLPNTGRKPSKKYLSAVDLADKYTAEVYSKWGIDPAASYDHSELPPHEIMHKKNDITGTYVAKGVFEGLAARFPPESGMFAKFEVENRRQVEELFSAWAADDYKSDKPDGTDRWGFCVALVAAHLRAHLEVGSTDGALYFSYWLGVFSTLNDGITDAGTLADVETAKKVRLGGRGGGSVCKVSRQQRPAVAKEVREQLAGSNQSVTHAYDEVGDRHGVKENTIRTIMLEQLQEQEPDVVRRYDEVMAKHPDTDRKTVENEIGREFGVTAHHIKKIIDKQAAKK